VKDSRANIGFRLRERRQQLGLTLDEVARRTGLTKGFISEVERDRASPSVTSLLAICDVLGVRLGALFSVADSAVVRADQRQPINFGGRGVQDYLLSPNTRTRLQAIWTELAPGGATGQEPYTLPADEAFALVLEGRVCIQVGSQTFALATGDAITYDPREPHSFRNASARDSAQVLFVVTPPPY
jgi:transcriptional regulator with XRE-family HTH domain